MRTVHVHMVEVCKTGESSMEEGVLMIKKSLAISEVIQILENANENQCISAPPSKPKASQVYLYKIDDAAKEGTLL